MVYRLRLGSLPMVRRSVRRTSVPCRNWGWRGASNLPQANAGCSASQCQGTIWAPSAPFVVECSRQQERLGISVGVSLGVSHLLDGCEGRPSTRLCGAECWGQQWEGRRAGLQGIGWSPGRVCFLSLVPHAGQNKIWNDPKRGGWVDQGPVLSVCWCRWHVEWAW